MTCVMAEGGDGPSAFRGTAGEVVRGFIDINTLWTALAVLFAMMVLGFVCSLVVWKIGVPPTVAVLLALVMSSPIIGRFALAARDGDLHAGLVISRVTLEALLGFIARHVTLTVAWALPVVLTGGWLVKRGALGGFTSFAGLGFEAVAFLSLAAVATIATVMTLLIATKADSVREALSTEAWRWVVERRGDLVPLMAALIGGLSMFALIFWPVLGLLTVVLVRHSPRLGAMLGIFTYVSPCLAAPVLMGRLAGAFVFGEGSVSQSAPAPQPARPPGPVPQVVRVAPAAAPAAAASPQAQAVQAARRLDVKQTLDAIRMKAGTDLAAAVKEATVLRDAHPMNPQVAVELANLLRRSGAQAEALTAAAAAIKVALNGGAAPLAAETFKAFGDARDRLDLEPGTLELIGRQLLSRGELDHAVWCFRAMGVRGGDKVKVQKGLIAAADAAARAGHVEPALRIYEVVLRDHPDTGFREFIETARNDLKARGTGARSA
jgi:hypothetical protein